MAVDRLRDNPIIILDTNALFIPFIFKINIDSELRRLFGDYQLIIPTCVRQEILKIKDREKYGAMAFELANRKPGPKWYLELEKKILDEHITTDHNNDFNDISNSTDQEILVIAKAINGIVVTNDRAFLKTLHSNGITTISTRGKKYLKINSIY